MLPDHLRIVGGLYLIWSVVQAVVFAILSALRTELQPRGGLLFVAWALALALAVAFAIVGILLFRGAPHARTPAIILAAVSLLSFPVGTAVGAYALWALLRRSHPIRVEA
jgi:hypothetical protein